MVGTVEAAFDEWPSTPFNASFPAAFIGLARASRLTYQWALLGSNSSGNIAGSPVDEQGGNAEDDALTTDDVAQLLAQMPAEPLRAVLESAGELKANEGAEWGRALEEQQG